MREQQAVADEKHASVAAAETEAQEQSVLAKTKDAITRVRKQAISRALAAGVWVAEADASAKEAAQHHRVAAAAKVEAAAVHEVRDSVTLHKTDAVFPKVLM